ncbi:hypothetical protein [Granulicella tundricola]|uniref:hypothetical protein n=1 Tax=Granulicella tundricola TaxID=940615 RepID=UPI00059FC2A4|nr:hypothetical protein [Granulicella tundricola]
MPQSADQVDVDFPFASDELLYRRAFPGEINSMGELVPTQLNAFSFQKEVEGAPSFNRGKYSTAQDVIHQDCAGKADVSGCSVFQLEVANIPGPLKSGDGKNFSFYPVHKPMPSCGAHSVLASCLEGDSERTYAKPSYAVIKDLRAKICGVLKPVVLKPV